MFAGVQGGWKKQVWVPRPSSKEGNLEGRSNCGQLGVSYTSGLFMGLHQLLCRQAGMATRLTVMPKCGDFILRPSWKLCNHLVQL